MLKARKKEITIKEALEQFENYLKSHQIENPRFETKFLLSEMMNMTMTDLIIKENEKIPILVYKKLKKSFKKKKKEYPTAYLTSKKEFYSRIFYVNENVLIPRPETEELAEYIISETKGKNLSVIDIGCGSGCLGITLALELNAAYLALLDISKKALDVCRENKERLLKNQETEVEFIHADMTKLKADKQYDLVVSNPPYVLEDEYDTLEKPVRKFEPRKALLVKDPSVFFNVFFKKVYHLLNENGKFYLETNPRLVKLQKSLLESSGFSEIRVKNDLSQKERFIFCAKSL